MSSAQVIRRETLAHLVTVNADTRFGASYVPRHVRTRVQCQEHQVWEALWSLVADGLLYIDTNGQHSSSDNWRWRLSDAGIKAATGGAWEPADPPGFLSRLRRECPDLDPLALRYVEEALRAFNARCYLATSVMLGVASEQVFLSLADAFVAQQGAAADKLRVHLENPKTTYHARFTEFRKRVEPLRDYLPEDLGDTLTLDAVADLIRVTRNAAGHPSGQVVDEDTARTHLQMAGIYLRKMTALRRHFATQDE